MRQSGGVGSQERVAVLRFAKGLGSAGSRHRERAHDVSEFQAGFDGFATNKFVEKAGIETVSRTDVIDGVHNGWKGFPSCFRGDG